MICPTVEQTINFCPTSKLTEMIDNNKLFKQAHKRSKREAASKSSSYMHKPRKERQKKLDDKHVKTCQLWKIQRQKDREYREFLDSNPVVNLESDEPKEDFDDNYSCSSFSTDFDDNVGNIRYANFLDFIDFLDF